MKSIVGYKNIHPRNIYNFNKWSAFSASAISITGLCYYHKSRIVYAESEGSLRDQYHKKMKEEEIKENEMKEKIKRGEEIEREIARKAREKWEKEEKEKKQRHEERLKIVKKDVDEWFENLCKEISESDKVIEDVLKSIYSSEKETEFYIVGFYRDHVVPNEDLFKSPKNVSGDELVDTLYRGRKKYQKKINMPGHKLHECTIYVDCVGTDLSGAFKPPEGMQIMLALNKPKLKSNCVLF